MYTHTCTSKSRAALTHHPLSLRPLPLDWCRADTVHEKQQQSLMYGNQVPAYFCNLLCTLVCTRVYMPLDSWPLLGRASVHLFILCVVHMQHIWSQATQARKQLSATEHLPVATPKSSDCRPVMHAHHSTSKSFQTPPLLCLTHSQRFIPAHLTSTHPHTHTRTHTQTKPFNTPAHVLVHVCADERWAQRVVGGSNQICAHLHSNSRDAGACASKQPRVIKRQVHTRTKSLSLKCLESIWNRHSAAAAATAGWRVQSAAAKLG